MKTDHDAMADIVAADDSLPPAEAARSAVEAEPVAKAEPEPKAKEPEPKAEEPKAEPEPKAEEPEPKDAETTAAADEPTEAEPVAEETIALAPVAELAGPPVAEVADLPSEPAASGGLLAELLPPSTTRARILVAAVLVALIGLGAGGYWWFVKRLPDGVAFRVDGVNVTGQQLDEQLQTLSALYGVQQPAADDQPRLESFHRDLAKSIAVSMAVDDAAAKRNIVVADRQVSDFLTKYIAVQYGEGQSGREAYVKDLADKNTSEPKVLAELKRQITLKQLFSEVTADITVTDQDVRQAFDQRNAEFATPERREVHNIVVKTKPEAEALVAELNAGGNFEAIAPQRSLDSVSKDSGGNLGLVSARDLQKDYAVAAFAAPVGGVFGPVETQQKAGPMYNVGKVVQSQPSVPADFDKVKGDVRRLLLSERTEAKWRAFMQEQIKKADIDYADGYRPADPDGLPPPEDSGFAAAGQSAPAPR